MRNLHQKSTSGSTIELCQIQNELLEELRFGSGKSKEKGLRFDKNILSVSSNIRKMSEKLRKFLKHCLRDLKGDLQYEHLQARI